MSRGLTIFLIPLFACSCGPDLTLRSSDIPPLTADNFQGINGRYEHGLWNSLVFRDPVNTDSTYSVKLRTKGTKDISVELFKYDDLKDSITLHGHFTRHGYFSIRQKVTVIPFFPVYFYYFHQNADLILTDSRDLRVTNALVEGAVVLIFSGGGPQAKENLYKRIE